MNLARTATSENRTIACRLTPPIPAAIATIGVQGPDSVRIIGKLFVPRNRNPLAIDEVRYGQWSLSFETQAAEQVIVCQVGPERIEIHAHGGAAVCQLILHDLAEAGCDIVPVSQWPRDALGRIESQAECDLERALTVKTAAILLDQLRGALSGAVRVIISELESSQVTRAHKLLAELLHWGEVGTRLFRAPEVCLAGPPNVGKSSLLNALLGVDRAIVHHEPGTTRDWVDELAVIEGWPVCLIDAAGIRSTNEPIEREGIELAIEKLAESDLAVLVVDAVVGWTETHDSLAEGRVGPMIVAWNKCDLISAKPPQLQLTVVPTSAVIDHGVETLLAAIATVLFSRLPTAGQAVPFRREHIEVLTQAKNHLNQQHLDDALKLLRSLL